MTQAPHISVVVPLYNEAENIGLLHAALVRTLGEMQTGYEIVLVDDGSRDDTLLLATDIAARDPDVRVISLRRNFGQTPAFAAGIDHARGEVIITMDGDMQNDPADIPRLVQKLDEGYDVVTGWRYRRQDKLITRRIPSVLANRIIGRVTGIPIHDNGCSLKAFRAETARRMPLYSDMHRFMPAAAALSGARIAEIRVAHHPRRHGISKYGLSRIYMVLLDLLRTKTILTFAYRPLRWFSLLALPFGIVGALLMLYGLLGGGGLGMGVFQFVGTGLLFFTLSILMVVTGILAELISRTADNWVGGVGSVCARRLDPHGNRSRAGC